MVERERDTTTIIETDRGGRGGGGTLVAIVLLIALLIGLYLLYQNGAFGGEGDKDINVDVNLPTQTQ